MEIYRENILDHYKNPRNFGRVANPTHESSEENVSCGDDIGMSLTVEGGTVKDIGFEGHGCAIALSTASMLTERVAGMAVEEVKNLSADDIVNLLGFTPTPSRMRCALLSLVALKKTLD